MSLSAPDSEVDICNMALSHLKQSSIAQIDPPSSKVETLCALWYHQIRQETLRSHPWNFAGARVQLTPDSGATPDFGFSHAYALPSDWIRFVARCDDLGVLLNAGDYEIEGRYFLFDGEDNASINLKYITDFQTVIQMDPLFRGLFAINLAIILAPNFSGSEARVKTLIEIRKDMQPTAAAIDGQERPPRRIQRSRFIQARRGYGYGTSAGRYTNFGQ